jgi:hypothetical protein
LDALEHRARRKERQAGEAWKHGSSWHRVLDT